MTDFVNLAGDGELEKVRRMLDEDPELINRGTEVRERLLLLLDEMAKIGRGRRQWLIDWIWVGIWMQLKNTALIWASRSGQKEMVELLISRGADVNRANIVSC